MGEDKIIDQSQLAEDVSKSIPYEFFEFFLVKPLDAIKVKKEFSKPVSTGKSTDKDGIEAEDFDKVETEVKEVDSDYRKGVIIKKPTCFEKMEDAPIVDVNIGDIVLFRDSAGLRFDLLKDSRLLRQFDILAVEKTA